MSDLEQVRAELRALEAKIDALAQERKAADAEPPVCSETLLALLAHDGPDGEKAAAEIRYLRAELARLREGLKVREGDLSDKAVAELLSFYSHSTSQWRAIREIARHRALLK